MAIKSAVPSGVTFSVPCQHGLQFGMQRPTIQLETLFTEDGSR
jgi:hypothetical protein